MSEIIKNAMWFEGKVEKEEEKNFNISKENIDSKLQKWLVSQNSLLMSIVLRMSDIKSDPTENQSRILDLLGHNIMSFNYTKDTIYKGQYSKSSNLLKQDLEILARITEIKNNDFKEGKTPNVKYLPDGLKKIYGDLNGIGHPSNSNVLQNSLQGFNSDGKNRVSIFPFFIDSIFDTLIRYHIYIQLGIVMELIDLFKKIYPNFSLTLEEENLLNSIDNISNQ